MFLIGTFKKPTIADLEWGMGAMYSVYNVNRILDFPRHLYFCQLQMIKRHASGLKTQVCL